MSRGIAGRQAGWTVYLRNALKQNDVQGRNLLRRLPEGDGHSGRAILPEMAFLRDGKGNGFGNPECLSLAPGIASIRMEMRTEGGDGCSVMCVHRCGTKDLGIRMQQQRESNEHCSHKCGEPVRRTVEHRRKDNESERRNYLMVNVRPAAIGENDWMMIISAGSRGVFSVHPHLKDIHEE